MFTFLFICFFVVVSALATRYEAKREFRSYNVYQPVKDHLNEVHREK